MALVFNGQLRLIGTAFVIWACVTQLNFNIIGMLVGLSIIPVCIPMTVIYNNIKGRTMEHPLNVSMLFGMAFSHKFWHVTMTFLVVLIVIFLGSLAKKKNAEVPGRTQNALEVFVKGVYNMCDDVMGVEGRPYIPLIFGIGLYVAFSNFLGLIPGFLAPTSNLNSTIAPAIVVFMVYNYIGIKKHGAGYIKHFLECGSLACASDDHY